MEIIPAIDIIDGKCVRLTKGDFNFSKVYNENPVEVATQFEDAGFKRLHLVDLDGAKAGQIKNIKVLESICNQTKLKIDFGGGIKTAHDLQTVFNAGAIWATIGSIAVTDPDKVQEWLITFNPDKFLVAADVKDEEIMINAWKRNTEVNIFSFIENYLQKGITQLFCTDISKDGLLEGPSIDLYKKIVQQFPDLYFIASGGVSSEKDILDLQATGCKAVIIGKAIYENKISLEQLIKMNN